MGKKGRGFHFGGGGEKGERKEKRGKIRLNTKGKKKEKRWGGGWGGGGVLRGGGGWWEGFFLGGVLFPRMVGGGVFLGGGGGGGGLGGEGEIAFGKKKKLPKTSTPK